MSKRHVPASEMPPPLMTTSEALDFMNQRYSVVMEGGRAVVITEVKDETLDRIYIPRLRPSDLATFYGNCRVEVDGKEGNKEYISLVKFWLTHPRRDSFFGTVFLPEGDKAGHYNLWRGFSVRPKFGDWSLLERHIYDIVCAGNDTHFRFLKGQMARCVQEPGKQGEVAVVLRGPQGAGKGFVVRELGSLFGQHFLHVSNPRHFLGHFNLHLQDAVVLFVDEAFGAMDVRAVAALKRMITEPTLLIEGKYLNATMARNVTHIFVSSNEEQVVAVEPDDRRFFVLDVSSGRVGDTAYFRAMAEQMNNGGRAAMLYDLLRHDYSGIDLRQPPATAALLEQKLLSLTPLERWWLDKLEDGQLLGLTGWPDGPIEVKHADLQTEYQGFLKLSGPIGKGVQTELGTGLRKVLPNGFPRVKQRSAGAERWRIYIIPPLSECRAHWDERMKQSHDWDAIEVEEVPMAPPPFPLVSGVEADSAIPAATAPAASAPESPTRAAAGEPPAAQKAAQPTLASPAQPASAPATPRVVVPPAVVSPPEPRPPSVSGPQAPTGPPQPTREVLPPPLPSRRK